MRPNEIQAELTKRNTTQAAIAAEAERSVFHVSAIINKKRRGSKELMALIAAKIGRDPAEVFPKEWQHKPKRSRWDRS